MYAFPLLRAKVQPPPLRAATLHRDRLLDWLDANVARRVMLVVADPGYGKTTLLADYSRRSRLRTLWYRLDGEDGNWVSFLHYLVAAGREADPGFAPRTEALLGDLASGGPGRDVVLGTFLRELPALVAAGPAAIILDDYHLVDDAPDVRDIMRELVARAPEGLSLIVLSRRDPQLPVSAAKVRGEFSALSTDDLRFRLEETDELFRDTYSRALETDIVSDLNRRTEGWPASLQLVETALRNRPPGEARSFVANLSGARGELYDYLAEEVVGKLDEPSQRLLMRTSILGAVSPELAGLLAELGQAAARDLIARAERLGLLARRGPGGPDVFRYHPLVRDFLEARLRRDEGEAGIIALHRQVAEHADGRDWHLAAYHYAAAGAVGELHRVLAAAAPEIMAAGEYALVEGYIPAAATDLPPALEIALSRMDFERGRPEEALARAERAYASLAESPDRRLAELALANLASVHLSYSNFARAYELSTQLAAIASDRTMLLIARGTAAILELSTTGSFADCEELLKTMARDQRAAGQDHYLAVTTHNLAETERWRGRAEAALQLSGEALHLFQQGSTNNQLGAAWTTRVWALAHLGDWARARQEMLDLLAGDLSATDRGEILVDWAGIVGHYGDTVEADLAVREALLDPPRTGTSPLIVPIMLAEDAIRRGSLDEARTLLAAHESEELIASTGHEARKKLLRGYLSLAAGEPNAPDLLRAAQAHAATQGAAFYENCCRVLIATSLPKDQLNAALPAIPATERVYVSILAEAVTERIGDLSEEALKAIVAEAEKRPERWREPLRRKITGVDATSLAAARILDRVGTRQDVPVLRDLARRLGGKAGASNLGRALARRLAPRVFVEDQGRVTVLLGDRALAETEVRRKVLALLCFLITRPRLSATRDEAVEALWPGADPNAGVNSLNQAIFFLRRALEIPYVEDQSPEYVHYDSDVLWLDRDLVTSRSAETQQLLDEINRKPSIDAIERLSAQYRGKFALDFAYEEWAAAYRDHMHAAYLEAIEQAIVADGRAGKLDRAIGLARRALAIDPSADQIEKHLLRLYHQAGSHAAAAEQFAHYSGLLVNELGVEPPTFDEALSE